MTNEKYTIAKVQSWIDYKIKSSTSLLFLDTEWWQPGNERKEKQLLRYIDAVANQGGGTIVLGIKTLRQRAKEIIGIQLNESAVFWLKTLIKTSVSPIIKDIDIYPIICDNGKTILIIKIISPDIPYMMVDDGFYSWADIKPRRLSEREIRQLYQNRYQPKLEYVGVINTQGVALMGNGIPHTIQFYPKFLIRNAGTSPEKEYKVELWFPSSLIDTSFTPIQDYFQRLDGPYSIYSIPSRATLFQEEIYTIAEAKLFVNTNNIHDFLTMDYQVRIYYSKGNVLHSYRLSETFNYQKKPLTAKTLMAIE